MEQPNINVHRRRSLRRFSLFTVTLVFAALLFVGTTSFSSLPSNSGTGDIHLDHLKRAVPLSGSAVGWHSRALARPAPNYAPKKADLAFTATQNTLIGSQFTMALFKPNYAVDAGGKILRITASDFVAFQTLIQQVGTLPKVGWSVAHNRTDYPVDILKTPAGLYASVYGWDSATDVLTGPTAGYTKLPPSLQSLIGLAREAWEGYTYFSARNQTLINQILSF
ncbi:SubName: Full=Uncharacterized protein {ECO:0000313/EMBL:CCA74560.1} [Serendipita indica DSM 11827]|uniref:Uncharacterized protein n=1 Tax=Serendipita indica (strain DSM 11827) TaxID=1109443 RepID=G4TTB7_SERID|nr:SubName: Full=Uncharacterized protein {ECO:0000313/EMBL:CCA74560.1} [Serendipita indica DSM 11827]CCA74560.1 hypothetical protein PIIN_08512 [Serendipita indica DSM 11827]